MEELIRQAFLHVEVIGPLVAEGRYDLVGPSGEIILPQVWESLIKPDWAVTMHMWPLPEVPKRPPPPPPGWIGRRREPPPPPPGWIGPPPGRRMGGDAGLDEVIVIEDRPSKKKAFDRRKRRFTYHSSDSDSSDSDSDKLVSDSEIDDDGLDEELAIGIDLENVDECDGYGAWDYSGGME
jgi:hypothetical protein